MVVMNNIVFPDGIWPVMITPYTEDNKIDFHALERLIHWYEDNQADGLFAVCQSSEMFFLSLEERVALAKFVKQESSIPVIASGHIASSPEEQIRELNAMAETGIDALILISNRLAAQEDTEDTILCNLENLLKHLPVELPLGFYECPYPYKRILSPQLVKYCVETGRFYFIKDTSCDTDNMKEKLDMIKNSKLKLYNANTATLLDTLKLGCSGYSGVMANFHPKLYQWLCRNYAENEKMAEEIQAYLTMCSLIEHSNYPVNAKYAMQLAGVDCTLYSRNPRATTMSYAQKQEVQQLQKVTQVLMKCLI